ncbi:Mis12 protein-domain-containing protein [Cercophora newfieldiana]|uniref:Mis12 protein-domain-containing protein n=1 Tax=Cercophora newfieldiana TaxID=92897 RepID=A0AA39Y5I3_9PEZI|nr:Mis12 protein-domain-containing protein [Cercophora newfieldiana]
MAALPRTATSTDIELLTEHFGYPPVSLLDDIINSINILAERAINSIEQGLLNAPPASLGFRPPTHSTTSSKSKPPSSNNASLPDASESHRHEIEAGTHQLETLLFASIDKNFDVFEIYVMRNILCIRPSDRDYIRLSHYSGLDFSPSSTKSDAPTVETVNHLRRRLQASQKLNCMLHAEKARNDALLSELRRLVGGPGSALIKSEEGEAAAGPPPFGFLHDVGDLKEGGGDTPVTTTTAFTLSQLQALRALSTSLRSIMPDLGGEDGGLSEGDQERKRSWRRERLEYVEAATRKHLENVWGLDLGKNGEVRDGEWGGGRSLGQDEVEGLEKVALALGAGAGSGEKMDES